MTTLITYSANFSVLNKELTCYFSSDEFTDFYGKCNEHDSIKSFWVWDGCRSLRHVCKCSSYKSESVHRVRNFGQVAKMIVTSKSICFSLAANFYLLTFLESCKFQSSDFCGAIWAASCCIIYKGNISYDQQIFCRHC